MNFVGITITIICSLIVLTAPRRWAILGVLAAVCYITQGQQMDVGGFHFTAIRMVLFMGLIRNMARGEFKRLKLGSLDYVFLAFAIYTLIVAGLRTGVWQELVGNTYNALLSYFVFRCLVRDWEDMENLTHDLAFLIAPLALLMIQESLTGVNFFNIMGGQEAATMRAGRLRCIGSFRGPHTAGTFGASLIPLFIGYLYIRRRHPAGIVGLVSAMAITYTSNASGPLMACLSGLVALAFWPMRKAMKKVRWGIVAVLVAYDIMSKVPVWYILSKISDLTGGDGWYRSYLMDQCWKDMSHWWFAGTSDTSNWGVTTMAWGGADLCNMYVACAACSGMGCLILFILILIRGFQNLGQALRRARESLPQSEVILWCLGCCLFAHLMTFFSVTYWDQMHVIWWGLVAMIASATSEFLNNEQMQTSTEKVPSAQGSDDDGREGLRPQGWPQSTAGLSGHRQPGKPA
jgi:hypothetical protein